MNFVRQLTGSDPSDGRVGGVLENLAQNQAAILELLTTVERSLSDQGRHPDVEAKYQSFKRTFDWYASAGSFEIQRSVLDIMRKLQPHKAVGHQKVRLGSKNDGGYICLDDFESIDTAFSFGVESNVDWDLDISTRGITVYQFDHTIEKAPLEHPRLIWEKKMIAPEAGPAQESIASLVGRHDKGHARPNLILKMDIEGSEWPVINATPPEVLNRFSQIICEMHSFDYLGESWHEDRVQETVSRLTQDYRVVHVHANNYCGFANVSGVMLPMVFEVTFANRHLYEFEDTTEVFPGPLDSPCDPFRPDLRLGTFRF